MDQEELDKHLEIICNHLRRIQAWLFVLWFSALMIIWEMP